MPDPALTETARKAVHEFRLAFEALRPELYRYCRHLARTAWDAEDLVQDTLARAFVMLASHYGQEIRNPRAWLFRVATNLWIDRTRKAREVLGLPDEGDGHAPDPRDTREAAGTLIARLSPQERVAVVLKDAFDLPLDEVAELIGTTVGAVKTALRRGRGKLAAEPLAEPRVPTPAALDEFCAAFNAGDLRRLTAVLLDTAIVELPGLAVDLGVEATCNPKSGILYHSLLTPLSSGVAPQFLTDYVPTPVRTEVHLHRGEHLVLAFYAHAAGEAVRCFMRLGVDPETGLVASVRQYYFCPEALAEVCAELGLPHRSNGYGTEVGFDQNGS